MRKWFYDSKELQKIIASSLGYTNANPSKPGKKTSFKKIKIKKMFKYLLFFLA